MQQKRGGGPYVVPIKSDGTVGTDEVGKGVYSLLANTTYYYALEGDAAHALSVQIEGDGAIILTSAAVEDSNFNVPNDTTYFSATGIPVNGTPAAAGDWITMNPATSVWDCFAVGAGWAFTASTLAVAGGNAGGAIWNRRSSALRSRLKVVVGGTGGLLRVGTHGKS